MFSEKSHQQSFNVNSAAAFQTASELYLLMKKLTNKFQSKTTRNVNIAVNLLGSKGLLRAILNWYIKNQELGNVISVVTWRLVQEV